MSRSEHPSHAAPVLAAPLLIALGALTMMGPFGTDAFLPAFPVMAEALDAGNGQVQLTLTGFTLGMALGQLFTGPLSDGTGRRRPLLVGMSAMAVAGVGAAFADTLVVLVLCCAAMGLGASFGMVISRAVVSDLAEGAQLTRSFALLGTLTSLGPILSPIFGVAVMALWGWRAIFVGLGVLAAICVVLVALLVPETHPAERRLAHPLRGMPRNLAAAVRSRTYVGGALVLVFAFAGQFAYIAGSPFLLQSILGLSPLAYSIVFGINGIGLILTGLLTARLSRRWSERRLIALGLCLEAAGAAIVLVTALTGTVTAVTLLPALLLICASMGLILGPASSYALHGLRHVAGTALAVIGAAQFFGAGLVAPLVEIGGDQNPFPFAIVVAVAVGAAWVAWALSPDPSAPPASARREVSRVSTKEGENDGPS
ncbi:multidrug effflux MFS transporter [Microbacterium sp.]|uniref:multidrug effflux MFS transporter n=1 Tax=Microbacterium sp. TaxID=51671 RepID=UPI003A837C42